MMSKGKWMVRKKVIGQVLFVLGAEWEKERLELEKRLEMAGIFWSQRKGTQAGVQFLEQFKAPEKLIAVTDDRELALKAGELGIACIGCADADAPYFGHAGMVTDAPSELEADILEEYLLHYHHIPVTAAETGRLVLREIAEEDFETLCRISRQEGMEFTQSGAEGDFFDKERMAAYIAHAYALYGYGMWSVLKKDGTLIGCCGLSDQTWEDGDTRLELQYMLDRGCWGQGYGTEMCRAVLRYASARTDRQAVWLRIHPGNEPSKHLAQKLGFVYQGAGRDGVQRYSRRIDGLIP